MKKLITLSFFFLALNVKSQVIVNQKDISQMPEVRYLKISLMANGFKNTVKAYVEYGQTEAVLNSEIEESLTDKKGKAFNSDIDMLNFLAKNGFELVQIIEKSSQTKNNTVTTEQKTTNQFNYILRKVK